MYWVSPGSEFNIFPPDGMKDGSEGIADIVVLIFRFVWRNLKLFPDFFSAIQPYELIFVILAKFIDSDYTNTRHSM